jgi:hypothetical protein
MFEEMIILMTCQAAQKPEAQPGVQPEVLGGEERTKVCFGVMLS